MVKRIILACIVISLSVFGNKLTDSIYWMGSASSSSVGLATTAKTNSQDAIFYNPAGINLNEQSSINLSYTSNYNTDFSNISYIAKSEFLSFGIGMHLSQSPDIDQTIFNEEKNQVEIIGQYRYTYSSLFLSSAFKIPTISFGHIGSSLHFHRMSIGNDVLTGKSINIGLIFTPLSIFSIGYMHHNVIPIHLTWQSKNRIPPTEMTTIHTVKSHGTIGIEFIPIKTSTLRWSLLTDFELDEIESNETNNYSPLKIGTEIQYNTITIKGGYNYRFMSFGASTKLQKIQFNYSFMIPKETLDNRHAFGINFFL